MRLDGAGCSPACMSGGHTRNPLCAWGSNTTSLVPGLAHDAVLKSGKRRRRAMERAGIEPATSGLQSSPGLLRPSLCLLDPAWMSKFPPDRAGSVTRLRSPDRSRDVPCSSQWHGWQPLRASRRNYRGAAPVIWPRSLGPTEESAVLQGRGTDTSVERACDSSVGSRGADASPDGLAPARRG